MRIKLEALQPRPAIRAPEDSGLHLQLGVQRACHPPLSADPAVQVRDQT